MILLVSMMVSLAGASFDCKAARHPVEKKICADAELGRLDDSLGSVWKTVRQTFSGDDLAQAKLEQKAWMARVRQDDPVLDSLRKIWRRRVGDWSFRLGFQDLRSLFEPGPGHAGFRVDLSRRGDCAGLPDPEGNFPLMAAGDDLVLSWDPATDSLRYQVSEGIGEHNCNSCGTEGVAVRARSKGAKPWVWKGRSLDPEAPASVELSVTRDSVVVKVRTRQPQMICGMGAGFSDQLVFKRWSIRRRD